MKSLRRKLTSISFGKEINHMWVELWDKRHMDLKYNRVIHQMIYDKGRSLTLPKKTSETG